MYQATHTTDNPSYIEWINTMDFVGYVIFFLSIFFVLHALYIIMISILSTDQYEQFYSQSLADVIHELTTSQQTWRNVFFRFRMFSSKLREKAEFKIMNALFRDTYHIPSHFNFGRYLSGCFEKYSLRITNISHSSWMGLAVLFLINYLRVKFGVLETWNCTDFRTNQSADYKGEQFDDDNMSLRCALLQLQLFIICGLMITCYAFCVHFIGRLYTIRYYSYRSVCGRHIA
jgi:hypothetical protein